MIVSVKYTIILDGLVKCPHEWDCRSLRANSSQCSTCQVLFSILCLHFACRLEWSLHNLSRVGDHVHLLPTSDMFRDLLLESDISDNDEDDAKTGHSLELAIWSLWSPFEHPIVGEILKNAVLVFPLLVKIERTRRCYGICERTAISPAGMHVSDNSMQGTGKVHICSTAGSKTVLRNNRGPYTASFRMHR